MEKKKYLKLFTVLINTLKVRNIQYWTIIFGEKKQLAYNINKEKYGNYVLLHTEFNDSNFVNDFKAFLNLNSEVLKYLIIKLDGKPIPKEKIEESKEKEDK